MKTDEEELLDVVSSLGGKAPRDKILEAVQKKATEGDPRYSQLAEKFNKVMLSLIAVQDIVIMPDDDYAIWERAIA